MSFRKRNVGLSTASSNAIPTKSITDTTTLPSAHNAIKRRLLGTRPSPLDGRSTTSTGVNSLDGLLAGHAGLPLGCSILIEENGTTDYAGAITRFFSAEGLVQGHWLHVMGMPEAWIRELPGVVGRTNDGRDGGEGAGTEVKERMKIAWRYENLGQSQSGRNIEGGTGANGKTQNQSLLVDPTNPADIFCHTFDLSKRLALPSSAQLHFYPVNPNPATSPFRSVLERLSDSLAKSPTDSVHRVVIPGLLSPSIYPPHSGQPEYILQFIHALRALMARYSDRIVAILTLPLSLFSRSSGLVRWIEILTDTVIELTPFPHSADAALPVAKGSGAGTEEPPQGLLRTHRLPILHERGSGNNSSDDDWTFSLSRRRLVIRPFNLPPVEGDTEAQKAAASHSDHKSDEGGGNAKARKSDMEF